MTETASLPVMLRALRLPAMLAHWQHFQHQALEENWQHARFLAALCEQELADREQRRLARHLKASRLPPGKTLQHFDFSACPKLPAPRLTALANDPTWTEQAHNLLLFGPSGVGKSHLACAIGHGLILQGRRVLYTATTTLVQQLQQAKQQLRLPETLARMDKYHLLILDDIGYVKRTECESSVLFELISHRYETGSLLVTSNHPFSEWEQIFPDAMMTVAAIDRLVHHATIIEIQAESYRRKTSLENGRKEMS